MFTPWGHADAAEKVADGIMFYSTPSHGGYRVEGAAAGNIPPAARAASFAGHPWYEEDCDWAIVVAFNPSAFKPEHMTRALETLARHHAGLYDEAPCLCGAGQFAGRCVEADCVASGA